MHILAYLSFGFMLIFKTDATATISAPATDGAACTMTSIPEGSLGTTFTDTISTVTATASAGGNTISYALTTGGDSGQFSISAAGVVTVNNAATIDYETLTNKYLTVKMEALDSADSTTASISCTVSITDVAPAFEADAIPSSIRVSKDAAVGSVIGAYPCLDDGGVGTNVVALSPATHTYFEVSGTNLQVKAALTSVSGQTYSLTVTCADGATTVSQVVSACIDHFCSGAINISGISSALVALVLYFMHKLF